MRHSISLLFFLLIFFSLSFCQDLLAQECIDYRPNMRWVASFAEPGLVMNDVAVSGGYAYVAAGFHSGPWNGLHVFDVSNPSQPESVGTVNTPQQARDVAVGVGKAFLGVSGGLLIIDVSLPPKLVGQIDLPGGVIDLAAAGDYAYVASGDSGLVIIDASFPAEPRIVGTYDTPGVAVGIALAGTLAYVADSDSGVHIIDVTDPAKPALIGTTPTPRSAFGIAIGGDLVTITDGGLTVIDVSDPRKPIVVGHATTPSYAGSVATDGRYAFITMSTYPGDGLLAFDLIDPTSPIHVGTIEPPGIAEQVTLAGDLAYCASGDSFFEGVHIIDVSFATSPTPIGRTAIQAASAVAITGDLACVGTGGQSFQGGGAFQEANYWWLSTVNLSMSPPTVAGSAKIRYPANGVAIADHYAYVAEGIYFLPGRGSAAALQIVDIATPGEPLIIGGLDLPFFGNAVEVDGLHAYIADQTAGLIVVDVSTPHSPSIIGGLDTGDGLDLEVRGPLAYVAGSGLAIVDISNPASPIEIGRAQVYAETVTIEGNLACVTGYERLQTIDIEDPKHPVPLGSVGLPHSFSSDVAMDENYAYVTSDEFGILIVIDVSLPDRPRIVGQSQIEGGAFGMTDDRGTLYIAGPLGLSILPSQCRVPYSVELNGLETVPSDEGIWVRWRAAPERFTSFWIRRALGPDPLESSYKVLKPETPIAGGGPWQYLDTATISGTTYAYKVDGDRRDGGKETIGPVFATALPAASRQPALRAMPNPAAGVVKLDIDLPQKRELRLRIYDSTGRCVRTLVTGSMVEGQHALRWDGHNDGGQPVASGYYLARLDWPGGSTTTRFVLLGE